MAEHQQAAAPRAAEDTREDTLRDLEAPDAGAVTGGWLWGVVVPPADGTGTPTYRITNVRANASTV